MSNNKTSLSLVFPAYNEEKNIGKLIDNASSAARDITDDFEIVVVEDGSRDKTKKVIEGKLKTCPELKMVVHPVNKGYGQTVWDGLKAASKDYVFFSDADLQFDLKEITKLLEHINEYDVVIGFRAPRKDPFFRIVNAKAWNVLVRLLFGLKVKDIDCAFKIFKRTILEKMEVVSGGATFSAELLIRLQKAGIKIKEVPVTHLPSTGKAPTGAKPKVIIRAFRELIKLHRETDLGSRALVDMVKFGITGGVSTILDVGFLNLFYLYFKQAILVSTFAGFVAGTINGYLMNNYYTYRHLGKKANIKDFINLAIVGGIGLGLTEVIMYVLTVRLGMYYNYSKLIAVVTVFFWNFTAARKFVFKKE